LAKAILGKYIGIKNKSYGANNQCFGGSQNGPKEEKSY
jgi:hypothetical protein